MTDERIFMEGEEVEADLVTRAYAWIPGRMWSMDGGGN